MNGFDPVDSNHGSYPKVFESSIAKLVLPTPIGPSIAINFGSSELLISNFKSSQLNCVRSCHCVSACAVCVLVELQAYLPHL